MEYNELDLLVKATDATGKITSTEYDVLKRPIKNYLQNTSTDTQLLLSESYYDTYPSGMNSGTKAFDYVHAYSNLTNIISEPIGLPTGTKTLVLNEANQARLVGGQPQYLSSVIYYDYKMRPLQTVSENIFGKIERTSFKLDFSGRVLESHSTTEYLESNSPKTLDTYAKNTYDQSGRMAAVCQKLDNDKWEPISRNSYSPMGELTKKKLGCDQQQVDYAYNIKGWLTNINKPNATAASFLASKDLFAMNLSYTGNFTGNITGQQWQTATKVGTTATAGTIQSYAYQFDELNRILKADFVGSNTNGISTTMYDPAQGNKRAYDLNGNILGLHRSVNGSKVDGLTYNYNVGNRLSAVTDAETNTDTRYFTDLNKTGADYTYDAMGNMITDANKHLTGIAYNHQNLPTQIQRSGDSLAGKMKYYYTGTGQKLMVEIFDSTATVPTATKTRFYLGGLILKGNDVEFVNTPEGRAIPKLSLWKNPNGSTVNPTGTASSYTYEYHLKDHLGNLRVACRCGDPTRDTTTNVIDSLAARQPAMAVQTNDYDAWGLDFGSNIQPLSSDINKHRYLYNGKEQVTDLGLGLSEYGFRWYDSQIAKFVQVDPLAEEYSYKSTYDYAENKPINSVDLDGLESVNVNTGKVDNTLKGNNLSKIQGSKITTPWSDLNFNVPKNLFVQANFRGLSVSPQNLSNSKGSVQNYDYYSASFTLPKNMTMNDVFNYLRENFTEFKKGATQTEKFDPAGRKEQALFTSNNPLSSVMKFTVDPGFPLGLVKERMSVITSKFQMNENSMSWVFSPIYNDQSGAGHPLAGNRQFGIVNNGNNTYTFFTRGTDKAYGYIDGFKQKDIFEGANSLWTNVISNFSNYINQQGGTSKIQPPVLFQK
jgi:RHS repeat-associated protein